MIRVLLSSSTFPLGIDDGLPRFVYDLAEALSARCEVTVLAPDAPGARHAERMGAVEVRRFTYFRPRRWQCLAYGHGIAANLESSVLAKLQLPPFLLAQAHAIRALVRERRIQVVNSHWIIPQGLSLVLAGAASRFRHVVTLHSGDAYTLRRLPGGRALTRLLISRTDAAFAVASNVRAVLDEMLGRPSHAAIQPVGVHVDRFRRRPGVEPMPTPFPAGYLLFVGRLHEIKGVQYLLQAMPEIVRQHPGIGLLVVGYGPYEAVLRRAVEELGIAASVRFAGRRAHAEIIRYFHGCRVAVVPSITEQDGRTEGMPTVVLEAMAAGVRVVGSAVGGIPDLVRHGENGWLCREKDPADLGEKILLALADPPSSGMLAKVRETAERYAWSTVAERYVETFERLLSC